MGKKEKTKGMLLFIAGCYVLVLIVFFGDMAVKAVMNRVIPPAAVETEPAYLAVAPFTAAGGSSRTAAETARNLVESRLVAGGAYRIIPREETDNLLAGLEIRAEDISGKESVRKLYLKDIRYIVTGEVDAEESGYTVTLKALHLATGRVFHSTDGHMGGGSQELYAGITALAEQFTAGLAGSRKELAKTPLYKVGDEGPGGGMIFFARGGVYKECSDERGSGTWERAMSEAKYYRGGGYADWYLPDTEELRLMYQNLKAKGNAGGFSDGSYWSSSKYTDVQKTYANRSQIGHGPRTVLSTRTRPGRRVFNFGAGKSSVDYDLVDSNYIRFVRAF
jgi:hypothetical protein